MWIKKEDYEIFEKRVSRLKDVRTTLTSELEICKTETEMAKQTCFIISNELYKIKKELEYYLSANEEKGVVYIPKYVVKKIVYGE